MTEAIVIGAGPAGLTAAYELAKLGVPPTVLEADDQVGGLSRTVNYQGYRFDIGGHRFFSKVPLINDLWQEILGDDLLFRPRLSRIHYRGRYFDYPLKALNALQGLGAMDAFLIMLSYAKARLKPSAEEVNFEQWVSNRFGYRLYDIFFKTYTEKVWGIPCTEIAADWAAQRIKNLSLREAVRNALFGDESNKDGQVVTTLIEQFHYPRFGPGMMWERCEELLAKQGHETLRGVRVERIRHQQGRVVCVDGRTLAGERVEYGGEQVISTMPLRELIRALDPPPPDSVLQAANNLRYRDYLTVVLLVKRAEVFPDNWIYVHSPEVRMGRIQNYKNWSPYMVPDPSRTSLGLEYFLWDQDAEWSWSEEQLMDLGVRECVQLGMVAPDEIEGGTVVRMKKAYPIYDQKYHDSLATIRQYLSKFDNLQTIGRNGLHRYNNQDHSMLTGVYAARNTIGDQYDVWAVNTEQDYHEEEKVAQAQPGDRLSPTRVAPGWAHASPGSDDIIEAAFARLDPVAMGVALGVVSGSLLFLATVLLLVQRGGVVGPTLSLLGQYLFGFKVTWGGAFIGLAEACIGGFTLGYLGAELKNKGMDAYAVWLRRQSEATARRDLLDKV